MSRLSHILTPTLTGAGLLVLAACSSAPGPASSVDDREPSAVAAAAAPSAPSAPSERNSVAACGMLPGLGAQLMRFPGADPDAPPATADQLRQWAAATSAMIEPLGKTVPVALDPQIAALRASLVMLREGTSTGDDDASSLAMTALDRWGHEQCGYPTLDVVDPGSSLEGVPASLPAGPVSLSFASTGLPDSAGFVLLAMRVREGADYTLQAVRDRTVNPDEVADLVAVVQPSPTGSTGFSTASLTPGRYLLVSPVGTPPAFTRVLAAELEVTAPRRKG